MMINIGSSVKDEKNNNYILDEEVGRGGFGCVFKAHRENDNSIFAVKTMVPSFSDNKSMEAFKNEITSALSVVGDNIVRYEYVHNGDTFSDLPPYIIMEYADGGTLADLLNIRKQTGEIFKTAEILNLFSQLALGMKTINNKLVHRDIKPDNILLCQDVLKITDFGLSKIANANTRTITFKGYGTAQYSAPEVWDYSKNTIQMDIYSMGIVFYEIATLNYPYELKTSTPNDYKNIHLYSTIINPSKFNPDLPASIVSLINRMLEKPTQKRFTNWDEIVTHIEKQNEEKSVVSSFVSIAISAKNEDDILRQKQMSEENRELKQKEDFCQMVYSQFDNFVLKPIKNFADEFNNMYAGEEKYRYTKNLDGYIPDTYFNWHLYYSSLKITFKMEILLKKNHIKEINLLLPPHCTEPRFFQNYIPQYKNKDILLWGEICNDYGYGFNIILLKNNDLYGDWMIMTNKNNALTSVRRKPEPFGFEIKELPKEINYISILHIFSTQIESLNDELLLKKIDELFKLK